MQIGRPAPQVDDRLPLDDGSERRTALAESRMLRSKRSATFSKPAATHPCTATGPPSDAEFLLRD